MSILSLCDCSTNGLSPCIPSRCRSCGGDCSNNCPTSNINLKAIEKQIQNQVGVYESQYTDVLGTLNIGSNYLGYPKAFALHSSVWGNKFNLRNQSDRRVPHFMKFTNVPTRGNSLRSTITANKPGAMTPGGYGVDVKHGSYARYLGKLKAKELLVQPDLSCAQHSPQGNCTYTGTKQPVCSSSINNKSYRFSIVSTHPDCNTCNTGYECSSKWKTLIHSSLSDVAAHRHSTTSRLYPAGYQSGSDTISFFSSFDTQSEITLDGYTLDITLHYVVFLTEEQSPYDYLIVSDEVQFIYIYHNGINWSVSENSFSEVITARGGDGSFSLLIQTAEFESFS